MEVSSDPGFGSFYQKSVDGGPCESCINLTKKEAIEDQKGGGKTQRGHQPVCNVKVTGPDTASLQDIPIILRALLSMASKV